MAAPSNLQTVGIPADANMMIDLDLMETGYATDSSLHDTSHMFDSDHEDPPPPRAPTPPPAIDIEIPDITLICDAILFIPDKKSKSTNLQTYSAVKVEGVPVLWPGGFYDYDVLIKRVIDRLDADTPGIGPIIHEALETGRFACRFDGHISHSKEFPKTLKARVQLTPRNVQRYVSTAVANPTRVSGVSFVMTNPALEKAKAAKAAQVARISHGIERRQNLRRASGSRANYEEDSNSEHSSDEVSEHSAADDIITDILANHPPNIKYDRITPVYINPENPLQYFFITNAIAEVWSSKFGQNGVDVKTPPTCIKYDPRPPKGNQDGKAPITPGGLSASMIVELVAGVVAGMQSPSPMRSVNPTSATPTSSAHPATHPDSAQDISFGANVDGSMDGIQAYLEWLKLKPSRVTSLVEIFCDNEIFDYRLFSIGSLPRDTLLSLGLSHGLIAALYRGVDAFTRYMESLSARPGWFTNN